MWCGVVDGSDDDIATPYPTILHVVYDDSVVAVAAAAARKKSITTQTTQNGKIDNVQCDRKRKEMKQKNQQKNLARKSLQKWNLLTYYKCINCVNKLW